MLFPTSRALILACTIAFLLISPALSAQSHVDWSATVYNDGAHNAFTDLIRWHDAYYLCFRHATAHASMDGEIHILRSKDLLDWTPCTVLDTFGDDRDPHFTATQDVLYCFFGVWDLAHDTGNGLPNRKAVRSHFASTTDGEKWSKIQGVYESGWWLWRVSCHNGLFYSPAYTAIRPKPDQRETRLLSSPDALHWSLVSTVSTERLTGEADFLWKPDNSLWLLSRTGDAAGDAAWFKASPDLRQWSRTDTGILVHSPAITEVNGRHFVAGRGRDQANEKSYNTSLWEIDENGALFHRLTLPSAGDTAYPGLIPDPASTPGTPCALFISWYSQHETKASPNANPNAAAIYIARVIIE